MLDPRWLAGPAIRQSDSLASGDLPPIDQPDEFQFNDSAKCEYKESNSRATPSKVGVTPAAKLESATAPGATVALLRCNTNVGPTLETLATAEKEATLGTVQKVRPLIYTIYTIYVSHQSPTQS
jgi:hypothetical protein